MLLGGGGCGLGAGRASAKENDDKQEEDRNKKREIRTKLPTLRSIPLRDVFDVHAVRPGVAEDLDGV